jgi:hypothetical protein
MKYVWQIVNVGLVILSTITGYFSMSSQNLQGVNPDVIYCSIIFVTMPIFAVGSVFYSVHTKKCETLQRPSWNRHGLSWWYDPLQALFLTNFFFGGLAVGSAFHLSGTSETGFWLFISYYCMAIGLLIGQFLVYRIFRSRIVAAK